MCLEEEKPRGVLWANNIWRTIPNLRRLVSRAVGKECTMNDIYLTKIVITNSCYMWLLVGKFFKDEAGLG